MEADKEKWIEGVLNSLEGAERARPAADLLDRIEGQLMEPETRSIPLLQRRIAVAAAIALLAINLLAVRFLQDAGGRGKAGKPSSEILDESLLPAYNLYE